MKYLMGLIMSFALVVSSYAQEIESSACEDVSTTKFQELEKNESDQTSAETERIDSLKDGGVFGVEIDENTTVYGIEEESGYYVDDPEVRELESESESDSERNLEMEADEAQSSEEKTELESQATSGIFGNECALNNLLKSQQGEFDVEYEGADGDLKMEREKDGDSKLEFKSENEYYEYKENKKGESESTHSIMKGNEVVEIVKNKDGTAQVLYQGDFESMEQAQEVLEKGFNFEGVESACTQ